MSFEEMRKESDRLFDVAHAAAIALEVHVFGEDAHTRWKTGDSEKLKLALSTARSQIKKSLGRWCRRRVDGSNVLCHAHEAGRRAIETKSGGRMSEEETNTSPELTKALSLLMNRPGDTGDKPKRWTRLTLECSEYGKVVIEVRESDLTLPDVYEDLIIPALEARGFAGARELIEGNDE